MKAQYAGWCNTCWIRISPGNDIQRHPRHGMVHSSCYAGLLRAEVRRKEAAKKIKEAYQLSLFK